MARASSAGENAAVSGLTAVCTYTAIFTADPAAPATAWPTGEVSGTSTPATTVAAGSTGGTLSSIASWGGTYGGNGVLDVASTAGFASAGVLNVVTSGGSGLIAYTGTSGGNSFTGCTYISGTGTTVATGGAVTQNYSRQPTTFGAPVSGAATNSGLLTIPIPASTTVDYFAMANSQTSTGSGVYEVGGALSATITFVTAGNLSISAGALSIGAS